MAAGGLVECAPAAQAVRHNRRAGGQPALGAARNLALAEALDRRQLQLARTPLGTGRDRRHEGRLARRAAAPIAAGAHSAEIGVRHVRHCNIGPRRVKRAIVAHHDARGRDRPHHQSNRAFDAGHVEDGETAAEAEPAAVDEPGVSVEEPGAIEQKLDATF